MDRCSIPSVCVLSQDQVKMVLSSCNGDEEEAVASILGSSFLRNMYAGNRAVDDAVQRSTGARLNEELSARLQDESLPRDVSYS